MRTLFLTLLLIAAAYASSTSAQIALKSSDLVGSWRYRSFHNRPEPVGDDSQAALRLIFGEGDLEIVSAANEKVVGTLSFGSSLVLDVEGTYRASPDRPSADLRLTAKGRAGTGAAGWVYDYIGFSVPAWPDVVNQRQAIVGTVIRTVQHGSAPAGVTASFVVVRK